MLPARIASYDPAVHRALSDDTRRRLLEILSRSEGATVDALADDVQLHPTTVRQHLTVLLEAGLVAREPLPRQGPGRPEYRYLLDATRRVRPGGYHLLAQMVVSHLATKDAPAAEAEAAGRTWGEFLANSAPGSQASADQARQALFDVFDSLGFSPTQHSDTELHLHRCPFLDLAVKHPDVVCSLHRGMAQGVLDQLGSAVTAGELQPFATASRCVLHLDASA